MIGKATTVKDGVNKSKASPAAAGSKRSPTFDSLRGMGVLLVMLYHLRLGVSNAWACIGLFFAGSGFVMTIMAIEIVAKKGAFNAPFFWKRRVLRLFPAVQAIILIIALKCALDRMEWTGDTPTMSELRYLRSDLLWGLAFFENFNVGPIRTIVSRLEPHALSLIVQFQSHGYYLLTIVSLFRRWSGAIMTTLRTQPNRL